MLKITYKEYFKYEELYKTIETKKQNFCVAEESEEYIFDKNNGVREK